jgi:N-acetylmuramoyl-L-alanine amidase
VKIFINPGHCVQSNLDPGAVNEKHRVTEAETVLEIGKMVQDYLERAGVEVDFLQSNNLCGEYPAMPSITDSVNLSEANVALSLHCNASGSHLGQGTEAWIYEGGGEAEHLARRILTQLTSKFPDLQDRGVKESTHLAFTKYTDCPAVLLEIGFIDNENDVQILMNEKEDIAKAIARGVTDFERDFY